MGFEIYWDGACSADRILEFAPKGVKCHMDRQVSYDMKKYNWEMPIQVGADLTNTTICEIKDNVGDNI